MITTGQSTIRGRAAPRRAGRSRRGCLAAVGGCARGTPGALGTEDSPRGFDPLRCVVCYNKLRSDLSIVGTTTVDLPFGFDKPGF